MKENSWIATYTGIKFYPFNPDPNDINLEDISQSLSLLCRFNGHSNEFYSVAHHSILIAEALEKEYTPRLALIGLLHDASEAYLSDIPSPIKKFLPEICEIEDKILMAVFDGLGVERPTKEEWKIVMEYDKAILAAEGKYFTNNPELWIGNYETDKSRLFTDEDFEVNRYYNFKNYFMDLFEDLSS